MRRRCVLGVKIKTRDELIIAGVLLEPNKDAVSHIDYKNHLIYIGSENPVHHNDVYLNLDEICDTINHEIIHWVLYYREDRGNPERWAENYKAATCTMFDNICDMTIPCARAVNSCPLHKLP